MDTQELINLALAVVVTTSVHALMEPLNIRNKVKRLNDTLFGTKTAKEPGPVKNSSQAMLFIIAFLAVLTGILYFVFGLFDLGLNTALWTTIGILVSVELINTMHVDKYHLEMAEIIKNQRRSSS